MSAEDLEQVIAIESRSYSHPWTRGNFLDSLINAHDAQVGLDAQGSIVAYSVVMPGVDADHLLNLTVEPSCQRRGWASCLLRQAIAAAKDRRAAALWLEVRASNVAALALYRGFGFETSGQRRGYYPAVKGREDAVLMSLSLAPSAP